MLALDNIVYNLLHNYDCVIIPGFGGFITRESPAAINPLNHTVKPYTKTVFFNQHLKDNDGLLAKAVAREAGTDYDTAMNLIKSWVDIHDALLEDEKSFKFDHLGAFYLNNDGRKWFSPAYKLNVSKKTYGLEAVSAHEIEKLKVTINEPQVQEQVFAEARYDMAETNATTTISFADRKAIEPIERYSSNWRSLLVAASVALLAHMGYLWVDNNHNSAGQNASLVPSINISKPEVNTTETTPAVQTDIQPATDTVTAQPEPVITNVTQPAAETPVAHEAVKENTTAPAAATPQLSEPAAAATVPQPLMYYLVYGSYLLPENAENLLHDLQKESIMASLLKSESGGHVFTRVVGNSYATEQEATEALAGNNSTVKPIVININSKSIINE